MNFIINELQRILEIKQICFICKNEFKNSDGVTISGCTHSFHNKCLH